MKHMKNNYIFIRHGQTHWNKNKVMHGQYDIPLNQTGIEQASKVSDELKGEHFDLCFCSPLSRARSTALKILKNHRSTPIFYDDRLKELGKGLLEGRHVSSEKLLKDENYDFIEKFGIETKKEFYKRVKSFVDEIESKYEGKDILIVAHSGTIKMLYFAFDYPSIPLHRAYYSMSIKNCKKYELNKNGSEKTKMKIGFFPMVADILHSGHMIALEEAKAHCDYLIVGLHGNPSYKDPQQSIYERFMQLRAVKWVDEVIPYENTERDMDMFSSLNYDVYFLGEDHRTNGWEMKEEIEGLGKEVVYLSRKHNYSSTRIKNACK